MSSKMYGNKIGLITTTLDDDLGWIQVGCVYRGFEPRVVRRDGKEPVWRDVTLELAKENDDG